METSASAPEQNAGASSSAYLSEKKEPTRIVRRILKEASVQSPLAAAPCQGVLERYSVSKRLQKHFFRTYKQKDEILERIRAQDKFATPQEERGLICWRGHGGERPDRDGKGAVTKYAWLNSHARIGFLVSSEWILHIECVNPPSKKTSVPGFSTSGAFVQIRRYFHNPIDADDDDDGNLDIQGGTPTNLGEMSVRINDVPIEINVRVGPLPSYAVIEINGSSVFWWRTQEALNFVPKKTRPLKSFLDSQGYENLGVALPDFKRQKLSSNTEINRLGGSVARIEDEDIFQSPNRRAARTKGLYTNAVAAPSSNAAPTNTAPSSNAAPFHTAPSSNAAPPNTAPPSNAAPPNTATSSNAAPFHTAPSSNAAPPNTAPSSNAAPRNITKAKITDTPALPEAGTKPVKESAKIPPKRAHVIEEPARVKEPSSALPTPNWKAKMKRGLRQHKASQKEAPVPYIPDEFEQVYLKNSPLKNDRDLYDDEVVKGITTLWAPLQHHGKIFAFGSSNTFMDSRQVNFVVDLALKGSKYTFIMPIAFPPAESDDTVQENGMKRRSPGIGHHLLAVARVVADDGGFILVTVLNSMHTCVEHKEIEEVATNLIIRSGWLGKNPSRTEALPVWPRIKFEYPRVPSQEGVNTCGLYTILNAWATMLELKITPTYTRRRLPTKDTPETPFIKALLELINLAIGGHMDTETIVAFMVCYGYVLEPQDLNTIPKVPITQNLNQNLVAQSLYEFGEAEKVELSNAKITAADEEDVQHVMDKTGCTRQMAIAAVNNSKGVRSIAPFFVPPEHRAEHLKKL